MKKAFITGASRGIGRAAALALAEDGFEIVIHCAENTAKAEEVKNAILESGGTASIVQADLREPDSTKTLLAAAAEADVLVLNASVQYRNKWENISVEECVLQLNCNFVSSLLLMQAAVPHMRKNGWGRIVTVGSVQEAKPHPDMLVYSASKAAQSNMMRSLSLQLAGDGITVNNVAPGVIYTDRNVEALSDPAYAARVMASIPVGFYGEPEDPAEAIRFLCSEKARYITGQSIFVDGGKSVQ